MKNYYIGAIIYGVFDYLLILGVFYLSFHYYPLYSLPYWVSVISAIVMIGFLVFHTEKEKAQSSMFQLLLASSVKDIEEMNTRIKKHSKENRWIISVSTLLMTASIVLLVGYSFTINDHSSFLLLQLSGLGLFVLLSLMKWYYTLKNLISKHSIFILEQYLLKK